MCFACALQGRMSYGAFDHAAGGSSATPGGAASASSTSVTLTGNAYIDGLVDGGRWAGSITYSFPDARADYDPSYTEAGAAGFGQVSFAQMQAARFILEG